MTTVDREVSGSAKQQGETTPDYLDPSTRRTFLGSSEAAAAIGLDHRHSPYDLWLQKRGLVHREVTGDAVAVGKLLEPYVLQRYAEAEGKVVVGRLEERPHVYLPPGMTAVPTWNAILLATELLDLEAPDEPWRKGHPDGFAIDPETRRIDRGVEVKVTSLLGEWGEEETGEVPVPYAVQVSHLQSIVQAQAGLVLPFDFPVLFTVRWRYARFEWEWNPDLISLLVERERAFWDLVVNGTAPEPDDRAETSRHLDLTLPFTEGKVLDADPGSELEAKALTYRAVQNMESTVVARKREIANQLREMIGDATRVTGAGWSISYREGKPTEKVDYKAVLAEFRNGLTYTLTGEPLNRTVAALDEAVAAHTTIKPPQRRFSPRLGGLDGRLPKPEEPKSLNAIGGDDDRD
jgi:predicted phage-related endonuclease